MQLDQIRYRTLRPGLLSELCTRDRGSIQNTDGMNTGRGPKTGGNRGRPGRDLAAGGIRATNTIRGWMLETTPEKNDEEISKQRKRRF